MPKLDSLQREWSKHREQLEREIRVLVVHDDAGVRDELERLLYRCHISARATKSVKHLEELVVRDRYSLILAAAHLPQMQELSLAQTLQEEMPDVDLLPVAQEVSVDLVRRCIELGVTDVVDMPVYDTSATCARLQGAVRRNVDRRMRGHVLSRLQEELARVDEETRQQVSAALERRLGRFKRWIGAFDRVLVEEGSDPKLRRLSEALLVAGMSVEATELAEDTRARAERGALHMVVLEWRNRAAKVADQMQEIRKADPLVELVLAVADPRPYEALEALRCGVALYQPWIPPVDEDDVVSSICGIQQRCRRARLLDALLTALFWESSGVIEHQGPAMQGYIDFRKLSGMEREMPAAAAVPADSADPAVVLEEVLDNILRAAAVPPRVRKAVATAPEPGPHERRAHPRVAENQFVRFRPGGAFASIVGYLGDLSEGGLFVRTPRLQPPGAKMTVDVNLEHEGRGYLLRCRAEVAWVAREPESGSPGLGFGVKLIHPPSDVTVLLQNIVRSRGT